jgi:phosphoglucomutase
LEQAGETGPVYRESAAVKQEAFSAYRDFSALVIAGTGGGGTGGRGENARYGADGGGTDGGKAEDTAAAAEVPGGIFAAIKAGLAGHPLGIAADFNGSARTLSIDEKLFLSLGIGFRSINGEPGEIAHAIIPEGESLVPCARFLSELHASEPSFVLGYVPDCDGDRGNLVIWDAGSARILEAQEVFALACVAELSHLVWTGVLRYDQNGKALARVAVAVNGPTSMRIDRVAGAFGVEVFRAEVGEANVVNLARGLRERGYIVRILGEGSNGGNITHPSAVRDPLATLFALIKLLAIRGSSRPGSGSASSPKSASNSEAPFPASALDPENGKGFFRIWLERAGLESPAGRGRDGFTLSDIIASLPRFYTTGVSTPEAKLQVVTRDHRLLKEKYQKVFLAEWEEKKAGLERYGISGFEGRACIGSEEKRNLENFGDAETGGLKIVFSGPDKKDKAFIWMRGSKTESVFRIMADAEEQELERELIMWQRGMVSKADSL